MSKKRGRRRDQVYHLPFLQLIPVLLLVSIMAFAFMHALPGM